MSCELDLGVQDVIDRIWKELRLIRIYTKRFVNDSCSLLIAHSAAANFSPLLRKRSPTDYFFFMFRKGVDPDFSEALIVRSNSTIEDVCDQVHRTLKETFKYALVWGASARHIPQRVGLGHMVADEDVVSIVAK